MIRSFIIIILIFFSATIVFAQQNKIDSIRSYLRTARQDTSKIRALLDLGQHFQDTKPDTTIILYRQALALSRLYTLSRYEAESLSYLASRLAFDPKKKDSVMLFIQQAFLLTRNNKFWEQETKTLSAWSAIYVYAWNMPDSGILLAQQGMGLTDKYNIASQKIGLTWTLINGSIKAKRYYAALQFCLNGISLSRLNKFKYSEKQYSDMANYVISIAPPDSASLLTERAVAFAHNIHDKTYEAHFREGVAMNYKNTGNYPKALKAFMTVLEMYKNLNDKTDEVEVMSNIGILYKEQGEFRRSLLFFLNEMEVQKILHDSLIMYTYEQIGNNYAKLKMRDSAIYFAKKSCQEATRVSAGAVDPGVLDDLGELYFELGEDSMAMNYFKESLPIFEMAHDPSNLCEIYIGIAKLHKKRGQIDSSFQYASKALPLAQQNHQLNYIIDACSMISDYYKGRHNIDSAFVYKEIVSSVKDSLFSQEKVKEIQKIAFDEQMRQQQAFSQ